MIKHFFSTLLAVLVAFGLVYGIYTWKQERDHRVQLASGALTQIARDVEEINERFSSGATRDDGWATLTLIGQRIKQAEATLAQLQSAKVETRVLEQQKEHVRFLRSMQGKLSSNL